MGLRPRYVAMDLGMKSKLELYPLAFDDWVSIPKNSGLKIFNTFFFAYVDPRVLQFYLSSRLSMAEIARHVGVTTSSIARAVARLEEEG